MRFEWDVEKEQINRKKHGLSFSTATAVFDDPDALAEQDRVVDGEARWQTIGFIHGYYIVLVAHTVAEHDQDEVIRIISARKATKGEKKRYADAKAASNES